MDIKKLILAGTLIATSVAGQINKKIEYDPIKKNFAILNEQTSTSARVIYDSLEEEEGFIKFENREGDVPFGMQYLDSYDATSQTKRVGISNENLGIEMNETSNTGLVARTFGYYLAGKYLGLELKTSILPSGEVTYSTAYPLTERDKFNVDIQRDQAGQIEPGVGFKTEDRAILRNLEIQIMETPVEEDSEQQGYSLSAKTTIADEKGVLPSVGLEYIAGPDWSEVGCALKYKNLGLETKFGENKIEERNRNSVSVTANLLGNSLQLRTIYRTNEQTDKNEVLNFIQYKKEF